MTEEKFVRELTRRADDVHPAPLTLDDVRGQAGRIRRRRRAGVAVAAAVAVVAVALPAALLSGGTDDSAPDPAPRPMTAGAAVLHDGTLRLPTGETTPIDVDNADVLQLGVLTDGRAVLALQDPYAVRVYAPDGSLQEQYPVQVNAITVSDPGDAVAWVGKDGSVRVLSSGVAEPATLPAIPVPGDALPSIDAVLDAEHLLVGDGRTTSGELTPAGFTDLDLPQMRVHDVSPDGATWSVTLPPAEGEQYGCVGLYDVASAAVAERRCDTSDLVFSPDGQHLLGTRVENNMAGQASTYDLALEELGSYRSEGATTVISRAAWADPTHLLVALTDWESSEWSLVRVGLDWADPDVVVPEGPGRSPETFQEFIFSE